MSLLLSKKIFVSFAFLICTDFYVVPQKFCSSFYAFFESFPFFLISSWSFVICYIIFFRTTMFFVFKNSMLIFNILFWQDNIRMLLDMATEMPDRELLIQKHFTSLLSSVWRVSSPHQSSLSSRNSLSRGERLFGINIKQLSQNSYRKPEKINMTNLSRCSKLLAAALTDTSRTRQDDPIAVSDRREEASSIPEQLEITLQFQGLEWDLMNPLPSVINLSLYGSDSPHSANKPGVEDRHLRSSGNMAENRFRYVYL